MPLVILLHGYAGDGDYYNGASDPVTDSVLSLDLTTDVAGLDSFITRYTNLRRAARSSSGQ